MNPRYRSAPPIKLYDDALVAPIEATAEFREAQSATADRSHRAKAQAAGRRNTTVRWAEELPAPVIPAYSRDELRALACSHYNGLWFGRGDKYASINDSDDFLDRISVNFLRHALSPNERRLFRARKRVVADEARCNPPACPPGDRSAYPWLADECARQT